MHALGLQETGGAPGLGPALTLLEPMLIGLVDDLLLFRGVEVVDSGSHVQEWQVRLTDCAGRHWVWPAIDMQGGVRIVGDTAVADLVTRLRELSLDR